MNPAVRTVAQMKVGETAVLSSITDKELESKLIEMGFIPGALIRLILKAPLNDPLFVCIQNYDVAIRRSEASYIQII